MESFELLLLLVWEDDVASESLGHQQIFTKGSRTSSQHLIWIGWDDGTKSEDEVVDHLLVEEIGSNSIGDGIFCELLRLLLSIWQHQLWIELNWIISKLCFGHSFEAMTSLR